MTDITELVFPAHAGMNRRLDYLGDHIFSVPRPRGDEPFSSRIALSAS